MADVRVDIDQAAVDAMFADWGSGVGQYISRVTEEVQAAARARAPVSSRGSKYAPPGYLRSRVNVAHQHAPDGSVMGMVGVPLSKGSRYPLPFVANPAGKTRNRGHRTARAAADYFLARALASVVRG